MMPTACGSIVHRVVEGTDADSEATTVAAMLLEDALVLRMAAAWRPFSGSGFEIYAGYTRLELDATASTAQIRSLANGALPSQAELATTATSAVAPVLDELYAKHVQLPVLSLSAGYRF